MNPVVAENVPAPMNGPEMNPHQNPPAPPDSDSDDEEVGSDDLHTVVENHLQNIRQLTQLLTGLTRENSPDWLLNELSNLLPTYISLKTRLSRLDPKILENNLCLLHLNAQVDEMVVLAKQFNIPWETAANIDATP